MGRKKGSPSHSLAQLAAILFSTTQPLPKPREGLGPYFTSTRDSSQQIAELFSRILSELPQRSRALKCQIGYDLRMLGQFLAVGCGGFIGAIARYGISSLVHQYYGGPFRLGTLCVNAVGCFAIGILMTLALDHKLLAPNLRLFLVTGVLGALTTFSTFGHETVEHLRQGQHTLAFANIATNLILSLGATYLGSISPRWFT